MQKVFRISHLGELGPLLPERIGQSGQRLAQTGTESPFHNTSGEIEELARRKTLGMKHD